MRFKILIEKIIKYVYIDILYGWVIGNKNCIWGNIVLNILGYKLKYWVRN